MNTDPRALQMIRELADAFGPSGFEDDVLTVARRYAEDIGTVEEDHLRNLYIYRKENTGSKPVLMLDAHSDEVGFMIHSVKPTGTLRFVQLGRWGEIGLSASKVLVQNAEGKRIPGIIAAKPVHFMTAAERANGGIPATSDFVIDIGATSYEDAVNNFKIRIGEPATTAAQFEYDAEHDVIFGKGFDCRIGCAALLEVLYRLRGVELPFDVVGVLSSQEEVGDRGIRVAVNHVKPDVAICFEGCPADDTFTEPYAIQTALKKGPMLRFMDVSVICSPRFMRYMEQLASDHGLMMQTSVREGGGNNGAVINTAMDGVPVVVAGVPVRYIHSMNCITSYQDFEATVQLVETAVKDLTPEKVSRF